MSKVIIIVFREFLEIALLLGLVLASTKELPKSRLYIAIGSLFGIIFSILFAFLMTNIHEVLSIIQNEVVEASCMIFTSMIIMWTIIWLQGHNMWIKSQLLNITNKINSQINSRLHYWTLSLIVTMTILREGSEIVLFVYGSNAGLCIHKLILAFLIGGLLGFTTGAIVYLGLIKISLKHVFKISSFLLILVAASMSSEAASKLTSAGIVNILNEELWNSSWLISNSSFYGKMLSILTGYDPTPNALQIIFYLTTILVSFIILKVRKIYFYKTHFSANA